MLERVDLDVRRGEIVVLEGPNGSGKTTLARIAAGLLEPQAGTVELRGRAGYLSQDPGRYLVRETVLEEVALAVNGDEQRARAALDRVGLGWADGAASARPLERRARAACPRRGRGRRARRARSSTSRRAASTPSGRRRSARGSSSTPRRGRRSSSRRTTASCRRTVGSDFVFQKHKRLVRGRALASRVAASLPAAALGARRLGGARPCPRRDRDAAGRGRRPRRRVRVARGRHRLRARPDARRDAGRPRRRGPRALRADPERPAGDRDRRRLGRRARAAARLRRRRAGRDRVELLPRPGRRTRRGRCSRGAAAACSPACSRELLRRRLAFAAFTLVPRLRVRDA